MTATTTSARDHKPLCRQAGEAAVEAAVSRGRFVAAMIVILLLAAGLRFVFPVADPPAAPSVGVVWHDEGAWVHNARNRALFGQWKLDEWNPMYVTPVLTGLEFGGFRLWGVGLGQARLVPELLGLLSVLLLGLGVARLAGRLAGLFASAMLATSFVYVMYNRAATIEGTMIAFLVVSWYGYARASDQPKWGLLAGAGAIAAYFTKASAVFFVAALGIDALAMGVTWIRRRTAAIEPRTVDTEAQPARDMTAGLGGIYTLAGLTIAAGTALAFFVIPHWRDYWFYNWQMSVTRKPVYSFTALLDRASWLPVESDLFTRMWFVLVVGVVAALGRMASLRRVVPAERLLMLWVGLGTAELILHDVQERRLVFLIPALIALAAITLGRDRRLVPPTARNASRGAVLFVAPLVLYALYCLIGPLARLAFIYSIGPGVRLSAAVAVLLAVALAATWRRSIAWLTEQRWTIGVSIVLVAAVVAADLVQFAQWAASRSYRNYEAMLLVGRQLPPGTVVHGKLANGLALESRIRPVFVGRGFGNYEDRKRRDDVRYVLTYITPSLGYEGQASNPIIRDVLDAHPGARAILTFPVSESQFGDDVAALIDKTPDLPAATKAAAGR